MVVYWWKIVTIDRLGPVYQKGRRETQDLVSHDRIVTKVVSYLGLMFIGGKTMV